MIDKHCLISCEDKQWRRAEGYIRRQFTLHSNTSKKCDKI